MLNHVWNCFSTFIVSIIGKLIKTKWDKNNKYGQLIFVDKNNLDENNDANIDGKGLKIEWTTLKRNWYNKDGIGVQNIITNEWKWQYENI